MRRPDVFTLDYSHPLAHGLVFAGLGSQPGVSKYSDRSIKNRVGVLNNFSASNLKYDPVISRQCYDATTEQYVEFEAPTTDLQFTNGLSSTFSGWFSTNSTSTVSNANSGFGIHGNFWLGLYCNYAAGGNLQGAKYFTFDINNVDRKGIFFSRPWVALEWVHLTAVQSIYSQILYVNGVQVGTNTWEAWAGCGGITAPLHIHRGFKVTNSSVIDGSIADPIIHNRALSPAEIALLADRTDPMLGGLIVEERSVLWFDMGGGTTDALTATDLVTGSPVLGVPALGQAHALTATGLTTSAPVLGTPALGQVHSLAASALVTESPVLGAPLLTENAADVDTLTAVDLVVGSPVLGTPVLGQIHVLGSDGLVTGAPVLGTPSLEIGKDHLVAADLVVEGPILGTPALKQIHALVAEFSTSAPMLDAPALRQTHTLVAEGLSVSSSVLGTPMLFDLEYVLQTRAELKSLGTTDFTASSFGTTHIELRCYGNYEVNEFGE